MKNDLVLDTENKIVLLIPIYSARDKSTGIYNLSLDGNFRRVCTYLKKAKYKHAIVTIPAYCIVPSFANDFSANVTFLIADFYKENAAKTRLYNNTDELKNIIDIYNIEYMVIEPNVLAVNARIECRDIPMTYWCVASATNESTPWFTKKFATLDKAIAADTVTACSTYAQVDYLQGMSYVEPIWYDANDYNPLLTVYFPFRISDESYMFDIVLNAYTDLENKYSKTALILTNPNNNTLPDELYNLNCQVLPATTITHIAMLKSKPCIPYFDINPIRHITLDEALFYDCTIIAQKNSMTVDYAKKYKNIIFSTPDNLFDTFCELYNNNLELYTQKISNCN